MLFSVALHGGAALVLLHRCALHSGAYEMSESALVHQQPGEGDTGLHPPWSFVLVSVALYGGAALVLLHFAGAQSSLDPYLAHR